jgi:hypothetical protein
MASIARSHGLRLTKLAVDCAAPYGSLIKSPEVLPFLKHFTALTDLHLGIHSQTGVLDSMEPPNLPNLHILQIVADGTIDALMIWLSRWIMPGLSAFACLKSNDVGFSKYLREEADSLFAFMAKHGAGLRMVKINDSCRDVRLAVFPYTPCLNVYHIFDVQDIFDDLPTSVTQIVLPRFGTNLGYQVVILRALVQTVQLLPPGKRLHIIRVVKNMIIDRRYQSKPGPFSWRDTMQHADTRRVVTWREFNIHAKELLKLGVSILDEQDVALTDVLEEMEAPQESICTDFVESATDTLLGSDQ